MRSALCLEAGLSFESPANVGMASEEFVEIDGQFCSQRFDVDGLFIGVCGDVQCSTSIDSLDAGEAFFRGYWNWV